MSLVLNIYDFLVQSTAKLRIERGGLFFIHLCKGRTSNLQHEIPARIAGFVRDVICLFRTRISMTISVAVEFKLTNQSES